VAKRLNTYVHVVEKNDKGEITNQGQFGPDDDLSKPENAWVEKAVENPDVWADDKADTKDDKAEAGDKQAPQARRSTK
jgi:hypothetical protein